MSLNQKQQLAVEMYADWIKYPGRRKRPWFEIDGAAGTGKTYTVAEAIKYVGIDPELAGYMAFVGKATLALRLNGLPAKTIHSTIYNLTTDYLRDENGEYAFINGKKKLIQEFRKKPFEEINQQYKQFVLDEGGMVGEKIGNDIISYGIPLMVLGDLAQLPPVMSKRMFLEAPDITLTEIMRQEKDSPIIYLSQRAKNGMQIKYGVYGDKECIVIPKDRLTDDYLRQADIVICGTNSMRDKINMYMRRYIHGITENYIVPDDKLICRQNRWSMVLDEDVTLVNGLIGYVTSTNKESATRGCNMDISFRPEFYEKKEFPQISIDNNYAFMNYADRCNIDRMSLLNGKTLFEFGYCITCHLAQGSQYDTVLVYVENGGNSLYFRQWLYTAITRAKKRLILVI